jgi:hypothetical protein
MESFRNKYVIHEESGHPGRREYSILGTREDLAALGQALVDEAKKEKIHFERYATVEHGQSSRVSLSFRSTTEEEISFLHSCPPKIRLRSYLRAVIGVLVVVLALIGIKSLLR